ncbi:uncharacterized protein LAESUDRAFT_657205 [Laetiporus sulphureus 93-53]|uniref:Uncharacterized protein n=1 Tax=Laetiporus sulphureus 93-53 TaxID=1314785 RepID=A0A165DG50_9APHY|nr:uncharacterized protein LAESUDRAFT_657205 [Laetiporus sulphureus 93-53]KZT04819.1 hypothetical protein LAESUDRAFT_657205 [Laetiporus sulphureus 93-53]
MRPATEPTLPIELATVCITSLLYGIFLLLFGSFVYLSATRLAPTINGLRRDPFYVSPIFIVGVVLLMLISANWVLTIVRLFDGLMDDTGELQLGLFFSDLANPTYVAKSVLYFMTALSQDTIIIRRLSRSWNHNKPIIIFPIILCCSLIAAGANAAYQLSRHTEGDRIVNESAGRWIVSAAALTFAYVDFAVMNMYAYTSPCIDEGTDRDMTRTFIIFFLVSFLARTYVASFAIEMWMQMAGISYMLVIIRLRIGPGYQRKARPIILPPSKSYNLTTVITHNWRVSVTSAPAVNTTEYHPPNSPIVDVSTNRIVDEC